jgi:DNA ligase (NAD+)
MNYKIKNIIKAANLAYSEGGVYILTQEDLAQVNKILNLELTETHLVDSVYDIIYMEAKKQWPNDKFFKELQAENSGYGKEIIHSEPMGSMEELKTGDWDKWKAGHHLFLLSEKLDGCSIILTYKEGKLFSAATRGRGVKGKDIMRHIPFVSNIPQTISYADELVVRGELLCPKDEIPEMLKEVAEIEGKEQKNGRNTIAGALNRKESNEAVFKHAHFVSYWSSKGKGQDLDYLDELGFETPWDFEIDDTTTEEELIEQVKEFLFISKYEIDGIILTQLDNPEEGFVSGTINPKCSRKFKIGIYDNKAESVVNNITWQPSKSGKLTPVLNIEPIELCGSTISNVTGHNYQNLVDKQCGIGSKVIIKRAGLVIPYLEEVLTPSTNFNIPKDTYQEGVDLYLKDKSIKEVTIQRLMHFAEILKLDQAGEASMKKLLDMNPQLENPLFLLSFDEATFVIALGVNGSKLYNSIQKIKDEITESKLADACGAFGPGFGESLLSQIEQKYGELVALTEEIENFGPNRVKQYNDNYGNWLSIISLFKSFGYQFKKIQKNSALLFNKYVICFTGIRDKEFAKYLEDNGATVTETFSKKVNVLIAKDPNGTSSKIVKAKEQGCKVVSLEEAKEKLNEKSTCDW